MKIAPLIHELKKRNGVEWKLVHTGQHYDYNMSKTFFEDFDLAEPDYFMNVKPGSHAEQTGAIMVEFEKICLAEKPDVVLVVGDVNSTLACAITAEKMHIKVAHVEAGLRSGDMAMPEEINRIVTDSISDYLFVTEEDGVKNLKREGKDEEKIFFVGNVMIDTLHFGLAKIDAAKRTAPEGKYAVLTLHRPSNVDHPEKLKEILRAIVEISGDIKVYFSIHPRTQKNMESFGLKDSIQGPNIEILPPQSYLDFLALWSNAALVLTDSGGIQEETTALGIPCFTLRENTERPITIEQGTNVLAGTTYEQIMAAYNDFKLGKTKKGQVPKLWDGQAAKRILDVLI